MDLILSPHSSYNEEFKIYEEISINNIFSSSIKQSNKPHFLYKISTSSYYGESFFNHNKEVKLLKCLVKQSNRLWREQIIENFKGNFFLLSNCDQIFQVKDIYLIDSIVQLDETMIHYVNLPRSISSLLNNQKMNIFNNQRLHQLISQVKSYSNLNSYVIDKNRERLCLIGDCREVSLILNQHYEKTDKYNQERLLDYIEKSNEIKKDSQKEKEKESRVEVKKQTKTYQEIVLLEKRLYDKVKPKIDFFKKKGIKFDIKNMKDNIKVEISCENLEEIQEIKSEIEMISDYFELYIPYDHSFISGKEFPSLECFRKGIVLESLSIEKGNEGKSTNIDIVGLYHNVHKYKGMIKLYLNFVQSQMKIDENINELNMKIEKINQILVS